VNFHHRPITLACWILLILVQFLLAAVLRFGPNQGPRKYPAFRTFVYYCALRSPLLCLASVVGPYVLYWWSYWISELIWACLLGCLLYELWFELFRPAWAIPRPVIMTFLTSIGVVAASVTLLGVTVPSSYPDLFMVIALTSARTVALTSTAATALIVCFGSYYGCHWRSRVYGLALGLTFQGAVGSTLSIVSTTMTARPPDVLRAMAPFSTCVCMSVWTYYFLKAENRSLAIYDSDVSKILGKHAVAEALHD
jgi:hypothetical protein